MTQIGITGNPRASDPAHHAVALSQLTRPIFPQRRRSSMWA